VSLRGLGVYSLGRLLQAIPLLFGVVAVNFLLIQLAPGDPITILVGEYPAPAEYVAQLRQEFGLDRPVPERLLPYMSQLLQGNFGYSFATRQPVIELIGARVGATLQLTLTALVAASVVGVLVGVLAARSRGGALDMATQTASLAGYSVPSFWLGQICILVFAVALGWLPSQGDRSLRVPAEGVAAFADGLRYLLLPALVLSLREVALIARMTRASVLEVLGGDFILAARSRGASESTILFAHALPNAAAPILAVIGYSFGFVFAGATLVETVFGWPGIGRLLFESLARRDYPVMTALLLFISATVVVVNLATDLVHAAIDPRVQYASAR